MAFKGVLTAIRPLKTNGDVQFIVTVPKQDANKALQLAGGFVDPAISRWVAVAVLNNGAQSATPSPVDHAELRHDSGAADGGSVGREAEHFENEGRN